MAENRVIGHRNRIPWHLPEDFHWFKQTTLGGTLLMGRRTFESIGRALPGRRTVVLSRAGFHHPDVVMLADVQDLGRLPPHGPVFVCGGEMVYAALLPLCAELLLTRVKRKVEGDARFPSFEDQFQHAEVLRDTPDFTIERWHKLPRSVGFPTPGTQ